MWNKQLRELLERFLTSKDSGPIEAFFAEHTTQLQTNDTQLEAATVDLSTEEVFTQEELDSISMNSLQSMHFDSMEAEAPGWIPNPERYRAEFELGKGGMASVWKMKDRHLLRSVALKRLHDEKAEHALERENFVVEAQVTSQLQHPGIVPIHDLQIQDNGDIYFTMREVKGQTFKEVIESVHRISDTRWETTINGWNLRRLVNAMHSLCQTLAYAHSKGVIHQDLKPTNIMVGEYGEILIVDWGIARILSLYRVNPSWVNIQASETFKQYKRKSVAGTPQYMPMEQLQGSPEVIDGRADIYALGVILFHILSKQKPFLGSVEQILKSKMKPSPKVRDVLHNDTPIVPIELIEICDRAMAQNPADRFANATDMAQSIQDWLDGVKQEEAARQILMEIDLLRNDAQVHRTHIESLLSRLDDISDQSLKTEWWNTWMNYQSSQNHIGAIRDQIFQKAQGAIVYAPQLPEIYNRLIEVEYEDYLEAASEGNYTSMQKIERRIQVYLEHLPLKERRRWNNIRAIDLQYLHSRQGHRVNIERLCEQRYLIHLLEDKHWINICGLAGVGKTHLAWQLASQWCKQYEWDLVFCDLTDCFSSARVLQIIANALQIEQTGVDPLNTIVNILNRMHPDAKTGTDSTVLIADNIEQLNNEALELLVSIQTKCSALRIITTSRKVFNHEQESVYMLQPMSLINSIELFIQHCQKHLTSWELTQNNIDTVHSIVQKLDGIPLAIELAGARSAEFSLSEILNRLDQRFRILQSKDRNRPTLQMALSWSCSNLSLDEKSVLYQMSIFPRQFSLSLAEQIVEYDGTLTLSEVLDKMTHNSLISRESKDGIVSYTMLKSIREYAMQRAEASLLKSVYHRHAEYFALHLNQNPKLNIVSIQDNLLVASQHGALNDAGVCCRALLHHMLQYGPISTGLDIAESFLNRTDLSTNLQLSIQICAIDLLIRNGQLNEVLSRLQSLSKMQSSVDEVLHLDQIHIPPSPFQSQLPQILSKSKEELYTQLHNHQKSGNVQAYMTVAVSLFPIVSEKEQIQLLHDGIQPHIVSGQFTTALSLIHHLYTFTLLDEELLFVQIKHAVVLKKLGLYVESEEQYIRALKKSDELNDLSNRANIIGNLGALYQAQGQFDKAIEQYEQAYQHFNHIDNRDRLSILDSNLGTIYREQELFEQAIRYFERAIENAEAANNHLNQGVFLGNRALCLIGLKKYGEADRELRQAIEICDRHWKFAAGSFRGDLAILKCRLGDPPAARKLLKQGEPQVREHKEIYGQFLCKKAESMFLLHDYETSKEALRAAETLCQTLNVQQNSTLSSTLFKTQQTIPAHIWLTPAEIEERSLLAEVSLRWGRYESYNSQYPRALHHLQIAERLFTILDDISNTLKTRYTQAIVHSNTKDLMDAVKIGSELQIEHRRLGNDIEYATVTNFLGGCYRKLGKMEQSLALHEESLQILENTEHMTYGAALEKVGLTCRIMGKYQRSLDYMERALAQALKNNARVGTLYCNVGLCHNVLGDKNKALHYYHLGIQELRKQGDQNREMIFLGNVANIYMNQEKYLQAETIFLEIITRAQEAGTAGNECINRGNYGELLVLTNRWEEAEFQFLKSIELGQEIYPIAAGVFTAALARLRSLQARHEEAMDLLEQDIIKTVEADVEEFTKLLCTTADIYFNAGKYDLAKQTYNKATALLKEQQFEENTDAFQKWQKTSELLGFTNAMNGPRPSPVPDE